jgi:class 3 adenylate cyclase
MAEERVNRKLAAILAADVVGYSRLMGADEAGTLAASSTTGRSIFDPAVAAHNGRIVKLIGDGTIVEFGSVVDAVNCALSVQRSDDLALPDEAMRQPKDRAAHRHQSRRCHHRRRRHLRRRRQHRRAA